MYARSLDVSNMQAIKYVFIYARGNRCQCRETDVEIETGERKKRAGWQQKWCESSLLCPTASPRQMMVKLKEMDSPTFTMSTPARR